MHVYLWFFIQIIFLEIQDDDNTTSNYQNDLNINVSPLNDVATPNTDTQQTNSSTPPNYSSSSTTNQSESNNGSSSDHGTTSWCFLLNENFQSKNRTVVVA